MIVAKFGGTSLANASQIKKVCAIMLEDSRRKIMVVSAPGKRFSGDTKVTDLLISLAEASHNSGECSAEFNNVFSRFSEIIGELKLEKSLLNQIETDLKNRLKRSSLPLSAYRELIMAAGEDNCAKIVAAYLNSTGVLATYLDPKAAGMVLEKTQSGTQVLPSSYQSLASLSNVKGIGVFPGFFGCDKNGEVVTFDRGGSDITGSVLAVAVNAEMYENFTDVNGVCACDPRLVDSPVTVPEMTYREMRELAYSGFSVLHFDSVEPVMRAGIPLCIKNTNNPSAAGTRIVAERDGSKLPIAGIAGTEGFCVLTVGKYLMNREIGFGRRLFQILEEEKLSFDHAPSGIDSISPILKQSQLSKEGEHRLLMRIENELHADSTEIVGDIAIIMLVGENLFSIQGVAARALKALFEQSIEVEVFNMCRGNSVSLAIGVKSKYLKQSMQTLYTEFYN